MAPRADVCAGRLCGNGLLMGAVRAEASAVIIFIALFPGQRTAGTAADRECRGRAWAEAHSTPFLRAPWRWQCWSLERSLSRPGCVLAEGAQVPLPHAGACISRIYSLQVLRPHMHCAPTFRPVPSQDDASSCAFLKSACCSPGLAPHRWGSQPLSVPAHSASRRILAELLGAAPAIVLHRCAL